MSNVASQSQPSLDPADLRPKVLPSSTDATPTQDTHRIHPSRLQHSPSLPNIWFPPHSGPIPREMVKGEKAIMQHPSAPSSPKPSPTTASASENPESRPRHVKYASIDPVYRKTSGAKTHARRRTERDQPHSLLTPPLTPSSSIRTTASRDSRESAGTQQDRDREEPNTSEEIADLDTESTRILLLGNVNRRITVEALEAAVLDTLTSPPSNFNSTTNAAERPSPPTRRQDPAIRGVNQRYLQSEGLVPVVFFDVRVAKTVKDIVTKPGGSCMRQCAGDELDENGQRLDRLTARLVTAEELSKKLGNSPFLDSIDGSFFISVQKNNLHAKTEPAGSTPEDITRSLNGVHISDATPEHAKDTSQGNINTAMLQNIVKSFGSVRFFIFNRQEVNQDDSISLIFRVEYHDSRDADIAHAELEGQVMFGMKVGIFGKTEVAGRPLQKASSSGEIPFPSVSTAVESFDGLTIGRAGSQSQMRTRFQVGYHAHDENTHQDPQVPLQVVPIPAGAPSPTFFYTSSLVNVPQAAYHEQEANVHLAGRAPQSGSSQVAQSTERQWDNDTIYRSDSISPCYTPDGICLYCPSRGAQNTMAYNSAFGHYGLSPAPPTPTMYYPTHMPPPQGPSNMINMAPVPHGPVGYDYVDPQVQPIPNSPWGFDPAIAAVATGPNAMVPITMNGVSPAPFFIREDAALLTAGRPYHPGYLRTPEPHLVHHLPHAVEASPMPAVSPKIGRGPLATTRSSSPSSHRSTSLIQQEHSTSGGANSGARGASDRNQLNLARIEDGLDTRTTVMVKNIPNKMSDADLTAYIGKVCPRRIDFLYLRMDFQNGCNVGYAFVNFIHVQDLLRFAKARLGEKWNMFSSEKVLQMSYANYQGKEALVEKFKNSAIMDERESWRPRIFYSSGPDQGLLEPFPAPTHIRRKERSSHNRGALFVPGINGHGNLTNAHGLLHNTGRRYDDEYRSQHGRPDRGPPQPHHRNSRNAEEGNSRHGPDDKMPLYHKNSSYRATR